MHDVKWERDWELARFSLVAQLIDKHQLENSEIERHHHVPRDLNVHVNRLIGHQRLLQRKRLTRSQHLNSCLIVVTNELHL